MTATGFGRVFFYSLIVAAGIIGYGGWVMNNLVHSTADAVVTGFKLPGTIVQGVSEASIRMQATQVVVNRQAKADKLPIMDSEAAGDLADVGEANFKTRFAALK